MSAHEPALARAPAAANDAEAERELIEETARLFAEFVDGQQPQPPPPPPRIDIFALIELLRALSGDRPGEASAGGEPQPRPPLKALGRSPYTTAERTSWPAASPAAAQDHERVCGYKDEINAAAGRHGVPPEILAGIMSRETRGRNVIGDGGNGHGLMQIDARSFPDWCADWKRNGQSAVAAIDKGAQVLADKIEYLRARLPELSEQDLMKAAVAAYNAGEGRVARAIERTGSVDSIDRVTTGRDYSQDVLSRASYFQDAGIAQS